MSRHKPIIKKRIRRKIFERDNYKCWMCGCTVVEKGIPLATIDHFIPRNQKGKNKSYNLRTACKECNDKKRGKVPVELSEVNPKFDHNQSDTHQCTLCSAPIELKPNTNVVVRGFKVKMIVKGVMTNGIMSYYLACPECLDKHFGEVRKVILEKVAAEKVTSHKDGVC